MRTKEVWAPRIQPCMLSGAATDYVQGPQGRRQHRLPGAHGFLYHQVFSFMDRFDELAAPRFTIKDVEVHEQTRLYERRFALDLYRVSHRKFNGHTTRILDRIIFERGTDAVAILPFDPESGEVVLIEQFRPGALKDPVSPWLIEIVAGMIDKGESEIEAAIRELQEESGIKITAEHLHYINSVYPSPGGCSERVTLYIGKIKADHLLSHGGLDSEEEDIRIFKIPAQKAFELCRNGRICNAAALMALQHLQIYYDEICQSFAQIKD